MFKYFIQVLGKTMPISSKEYEDYMTEEAIDSGETKTTAKRVIRENRQEAREDGKNEFTLSSGAKVIVSFKKTKAMYEEEFYGMKVGERLLCIKGFTHGNMGTICRKGQKYKVYDTRVETSGDTDYAIGRITEDGGVWMCTSFIAEHFIKEEK